MIFYITFNNFQSLSRRWKKKTLSRSVLYRLYQNNGCLLLSVTSLAGILLVFAKMSLKASATASPVLVLSGRYHTYLENVSMTSRIYLQPLFYSSNFTISIRSAIHKSSFPALITWFLLNRLLTGLCRL